MIVGTAQDFVPYFVGLCLCFCFCVILKPMGFNFAN